MLVSCKITGARLGSISVSRSSTSGWCSVTSRASNHLSWRPQSRVGTKRPFLTVATAGSAIGVEEIVISNGKSRGPSMEPADRNVKAAADKLDVKGDMLDPSLANNKWVRLAAIGAAVVAAAGGSSVALRNAAPFMHLVAFGIWFGTLIYTTFILGITMFKNLPRQTFGRLQSKLFPQYFGLSAGCLVFQLATLIAGPGLARQQAIHLGLALALTLANLLVVEPKTTALMFQRYELENAAQRDEEQIARLKKQFGGLHGLSSIVNLSVVVCAVAHAWWLGQSLSLPAGALLTAKSFGL